MAASILIGTVRKCYLYSIFNVRFYSRGLKRTPASVINAVEYDDFANKKKVDNHYMSDNVALKPTRLISVKQESPKNIKPYLAANSSSSANVKPSRVEHIHHLNKKKDLKLADNIKYEFLTEGDRRFGPIITIAKSRKAREEKGIILLEGVRLINDAIDAGVKIKSFYFSKVELLNEIAYQDTGAELYKVRPDHMRLWSDVTTSQGIMAICKLPPPGQMTMAARDCLPITLILDNIREPGNMGTLLRTAAAAGCEKVLTTKGCVDVWEPKVLRSAAGCHFRLHILNNIGWELVGNYLSPKTRLYLADSKSRIRDSKTSKKGLMAKISNVKPQIYTVVSESETRGEKMGDDETEEKNTSIVDETFLDRETVQLYRDMPLKGATYSDVCYEGPAALIIGGETEGLSPDARKLTFEHGGEQVHIPMLKGVESLNAGVAASVILFEMNKQIKQQRQADMER